MTSRTARRLGLASLLAISALQIACPPPWLYWRDVRHHDRGHDHGDRYDHDDRLAGPVFAQDVGASISIGHPGFYGRIDIGDAPRPRILYREPVVVEVERVVISEPIYLRVRPGHAKNWREHCREYNACGERVYFVQDAWYADVYAPHYRERHGHHDGDDSRGEGRNRGHGHGKGHKN